MKQIKFFKLWLIRLKGYYEGDIYKKIFLFSGTLFYLDWLLITNPKSYNSLINYIYGNLTKSYSAFNYKNRYKLSYILMLIHFILFFVYIKSNIIGNILINVYPLFVQLFLFFKLRIIINHKKYYHG